MTAYMLIAGFLASADPATVHVACDYYDFAHDVTYRSRLFTAPAPASPLVHDMPEFVAPFGEAIKAQFGFTPDPKHLECLVVGPVSLPGALKKDADLSLWDASERRVDWPSA